MNLVALRWVIGLCLGVTLHGWAAEHRVATLEEMNRVVPQLAPGDVVIMKNGTWPDTRITFSGKGTLEKPITLKAQTPGRVVLAGDSTIRVEGEHLVVQGLLLKSVSGSSDAVRITGNHCRLTDTAIADGTCKTFVHVLGTEHRVDHCFFAGKTSESPTLQVNVGEVPNRHVIELNHFGHRPPLGRNGGETIRIGYSHQSMSNSLTVVQRNLFERCDGELEIISSKSCGNVYRQNTFLNCAGTLTLRHGNGCRVEDNFFIAQNKRGSGGIRVIGEDHVILNNYIEGMAMGGIWLTAGIPDSPLVGYFQAKNAIIAFNTVVDSRGPCIDLSAGLGSAGRKLVPTGLTITNNLFAPASGGTGIKGQQGENVRWAGNVMIYPAGEQPARALPDGVRSVEDRKTRSLRGLWQPLSGAGSTLPSGTPPKGHPLSAADVGPSWLPPLAR